MRIEYFGHSCFRITNADGTRWLTDPYTGVGYALPSGLQADVVTVSHGHFDHNNIAAVSGTYKLLSRPESVAFGGFFMQGAHSWHDEAQGRLRGENILFSAKADGLSVCHFGDLGEAATNKYDDMLSAADIWLLPVGGKYTIDGEAAWQYVKRLAPKCVIPMHYLPSDGTLDIAPIDVFLRAASGISPIFARDGEIELTSADLAEGKTKIICMGRKRV